MTAAPSGRDGPHRPAPTTMRGGGCRGAPGSAALQLVAGGIGDPVLRDHVLRDGGSSPLKLASIAAFIGSPVAVAENWKSVKRPPIGISPSLKVMVRPS